MNKLILKIKKLTDSAKTPKKAHINDAAFDIFADEDAVVLENDTKLVKTGICLGIPIGYCGILKGRSSLAKAGVNVLGGVIDEGYTGEIMVILHSINSYKFNKGDKIAQLLIVPVPLVETLEVDEIEKTERGEKGFGSTGK